MRLPLGIPAGVDSPLGKRLAGITFFRLVVLAVFLVIIESYYLREMAFGGFSSIVGLTTASAAFTASAGYAIMLRRGRGLVGLAHAQLLTDQLTWTVIVYISGGVTSGSVSLYGLTCLSGAILLGTPGAINAGLSGMGFYIAMCAGFAYDVLPPPPDQWATVYVIDVENMAYPAFSAVMAIGVVTMLAAYLSERLRAVGGRLEAVTKRVEEAERLAALGRLAAGLAHEIRNPLSSIRGSMELLRTGPGLDEEDKDLCELVEREVARLDHLVSDMVDLSRPRKPNPAEMDLAETARHVVKLSHSSARAEDVEVAYDGPETLRVMADADQMHQVLWNLVRNAMQVSAAGETVEVKLTRREDGDALMEVVDHGPGIPSSRRTRIFEAFFSTRSHGVGIGLAVVKRVIDDHGFDMIVDSVEGEGATFRMRVPSARVIAITLLLPLMGACSPASEWVDPVGPSDTEDTGDWWGEPPPRAPAAGSAKPAPTAPPNRYDRPLLSQQGDRPAVSITLHGDAVSGAKGEFRNTYYDFPHEAEMPIGDETRQVFDASCKPIRRVRRAFHDALCVQGSGKLATGQTVSFAKRDCECAAECPRTGQKICFEMLDPKRFPFGRGAMGTPITPLRSVAVDSKVLPLGTVLYIPAFHGLRDLGGQPHDGCFVAEDRGSRVIGKHVDVFTGSPRLTKAWNAAVPSNEGVQVIPQASRCKYLKKR